MTVNPQDLIRAEELAARGLPEQAYIDNMWNQSPGAARVIAIKRGEMGVSLRISSAPIARLSNRGLDRLAR